MRWLAVDRARMWEEAEVVGVERTASGTLLPLRLAEAPDVLPGQYYLVRPAVGAPPGVVERHTRCARRRTHRRPKSRSRYERSRVAGPLRSWRARWRWATSSRYADPRGFSPGPRLRVGRWVSSVPAPASPRWPPSCATPRHAGSLSR